MKFFRELRVLSEMLTIFLISKFDVIYKFTEEEVKKLREYTFISGDTYLITCLT
ncbi:MAG: hypothetical protein PV340_00810 [Wolbachia sp.]|nr:hypothetical protein [Wolbachia sp.]MDD9336335.1 hypothetical protein [Wolbachia sp.]